jgi:hypothetical protein
MSWDISAGLEAGYELDGLEIRIRFPANDISLFHSVQTSSGAHEVSYVMGIGDSFLGG